MYKTTKDIDSLRKKIRDWVKDYREMLPSNLEIDYETFEGSAMQLLIKCAGYLKEYRDTVENVDK